jgi:sorbitol-specific phosphotransferase system component IIBC
MMGSEGPVVQADSTWYSEQCVVRATAIAADLTVPAVRAAVARQAVTVPRSIGYAALAAAAGPPKSNSSPVTQIRCDPVHFGMIMLLNLGIGLCHPPVGAILFVGCAVGRVTIEQVVREIWPFYGVMFFVLMLVTYIPSVSLWLPRMLGL